ncbi:MAG: hypothetical protein NC418_02315 [Muribaculaceae bacterium]|nr:hypothetical protein [Muribaculaceae bacterium]
MNTTRNIGDLMGFFNITSNPIFAQFYNSVFAKGENQNLDIRGAKWGRLQDVFTYEMWERYNNMEVMATFVDLYSDPRAIGGSVKYNKLTGSIPRHKAIMTMDEVDVTEKKHDLYAMRSALHGRANADIEAAVNADLEDWYYDKFSAIPNAHKNTLNFMVGQLKSTLDFKLDNRSNPNGIQGLTFPSHVPTENRKTVKFWTKGKDGKITYNIDVNPVEYWQQLVYDIRNHPTLGYDRITLEMNAKSFKIMMKHPAWAKAIAYQQNSAFYLTANNDKNATAFGMNWLLTAKLEAQIAIFKEICDIDEVLLSTAVTATETAIKLTDAAPSLRRNKMDCFDEGRALLRPSGDIITIIPVAPNRTDYSAVISTDIFGGRGLIEYWYDPKEKVSTYRSELTCLPVFTVPSQCYNVAFVEEETTSGGGEVTEP